MGGVLHFRCDRTQIHQAQYNEFGREAGSRTGPLRGLRHRSGKIVREQDHQRGRGGVKVYPRASSEDEFFFSYSDTPRLELSGVFRIAIPLFGWPLLLFISLFRSSSSYTCQSSMIVACQGYDHLQPYNLEAWVLSICPRTFLTPRRGLWT